MQQRHAALLKMALTLRKYTAFGIKDILSENFDPSATLCCQSECFQNWDNFAEAPSGFIRNRKGFSQEKGKEYTMALHMIYLLLINADLS